MKAYKGDIERVIFTESEIGKRIDEIAAQITEDYAGREVVIVGVLKGATIFLAELIRRLDLQIDLDFVELITYGNRTSPQQEVILAKDVRKSVRGRDVLIIEDIVDTGITISFVIEHLEIRRPASVEICTLLSKPVRLRTEVPLKYVCFEIEDIFAVGYGLDYGERYRNLPDIVKLKDEVITDL